MRKLILAANWKMNGSKAMLKTFFNDFLGAIDTATLDSPNQKLYFGLPCLYLDAAKSHIPSTEIGIAAQNCHWEESGAFTGEISPNMLQDLGINTVIIGHSERRQYFNENEESLAKKARLLAKLKMRMIYCIGETREQREADKTLSVLEMQMNTLFSALPESLEQVVLAYEPVWAIGTGLAATPGQAQEVHSFIRRKISERYGNSSAQGISLLYGGSSNAGNVASLIEKSDIDGFLVGGASLKPGEFATMWSEICRSR